MTPERFFYVAHVTAMVLCFIIGRYNHSQLFLPVYFFSYSGWMAFGFNYAKQSVDFFLLRDVSSYRAVLSLLVTERKKKENPHQNERTNKMCLFSHETQLCKQMTVCHAVFSPKHQTHIPNSLSTWHFQRYMQLNMAKLNSSSLQIIPSRKRFLSQPTALPSVQADKSIRSVICDSFPSNSLPTPKSQEPLILLPK